MPAEDRTTLHLETGEVAGYLDGRLSHADQERVEEHLSSCSDCRAELVEVRQLLTSFSRRRSRLRLGALGAAGVAAAAAIVLMVSRPGRDNGPGGPTTRSRDEGRARISVVRPVAGAPLEATAVQFVWHSAGPEAQYRITVTTEGGDVVWASPASADTVRLIPSGVGLWRGQRYFWYVDALMPDGRSASSDVLSFTVSP